MKLTANKRILHKKHVRKIRDERRIPAVIFGKGFDSISIDIDFIEFRNVFREAGETGLIDVEVGEETYKVLVKEIQRDPLSLKFSHIGFYKPDLTQTTEANVPVETINEEENELVKSGEALVLVLMNEITVEALPADLPSSFEVDVSEISEIGEGVLVSQLKFDKQKVTLVDVEEDDLVVKLDYAEMQETEEEISEEEALADIEATEETAEGEEGEGAEKGKEEEKSTEDKPEEAPQE